MILAKWTKPFLMLIGMSALILVLNSCAHRTYGDVNNICSIFRGQPGWYRYAEQSFEKWGVPIHVQMAIVHQESRFKAYAKPPRRKLLGIIPLGRKTSAYGYAQVLDTTWDWYKLKTGNRYAKRDDFKDVTDFIGWYGTKTYELTGVSRWNAYDQYLAYHEGHGGYNRKSFLKKKWLIRVAQKVQIKANQFQEQLRVCK